MDDIPEQLLKKYKSSIPEKIKTFQTLIEKVKAEPSLETAEELKGFAHKIASNSHMFGYQEASLLFRELERLLKNLIENSPNDLSALNQCDEYFKKIIQVFK